MRNQIQFSATALNGTGKQGKLAKDANGYYTQPIGGLNVFNSTGDYYPYEAAKSLFIDSSSLMRRVTTGCLKSECGHPKPLPGQSLDSFANRVMAIEETRVCAHIGQIWLDFDSVRDETGKPVVAIMAKIAPSGPMSTGLSASFENGKEDVCFSIRAFTEDQNVIGIKHRMLRQIITWDHVTEPGINIARKYKSPVLESRDQINFTKEDILKAAAIPASQGYVMESTRALNNDLLSVLGWSNLDKPNMFKW